MCSDMNQPITRRSAHDVGDAWTTVDAAELYEIARWGQGYFSIGENGHVKIHPTKEPHRSIDLKQLVDHLQLRGISLPTLVRFRDILQHRLQDIHEAFQAAISAARIRRQLHLRLSDQGEPAAPGGRRGAEFRQAVQVRPRGRFEARAHRGGRDCRQRDADHLQRIQGRRVHRDGDAGPEDRAARSFRWSRNTPSSTSFSSTPRASACARTSACGSSSPPGAADAGSRRAATGRNSA